MSSATIEIRGDYTVLERLAAVNPFDALAPIAEALVDQTKQNFANESDPWGVPWEPLAPGYRPGGRILQDDRILHNSISPVIQRDRAGVGTNIEYAPTHQFGAAKGEYGSTRRGAPIPWGDIPARPFLALVDRFDELPRRYQADIIETLEALYESAQ